MSERIGLLDSTMDIASKMSEGNPGALAAICEVMRDGAAIDPDAGPLGGVAPILVLDTAGIYGSNIYILWNDRCERNVTGLIALTRALQLGLMTQARLVELSQDGPGLAADVLDFDSGAIIAQVREALPNFASVEG